MPVSFAVLECESEGPKSPCAGGGSRPLPDCPDGGVRHPRSLCLRAEQTQTEGPEFASPGRAKSRRGNEGVCPRQAMC
jgi:hypothetical protein